MHLKCEFQITGDYQLSSKVAVQTDNGKERFAFELRVVKRENKSVFVCAPEKTAELFVCAPDKTTKFSLLEKLETTVLDALSLENSVNGYFLERWDQGYVAPTAEFDFSVFDAEDAKMEEYSHEDLEDEEQKATREAKEQKAANADMDLPEATMANEEDVLAMTDAATLQ